MSSVPPESFWACLRRPFTILAPMEDVTDTVFRHLIADRGAPDVFMSEFINAGELLHPKRKFARQRAFIDPVEFQSLGLGEPLPLAGESQSDSPRRSGTGVSPYLIAQIWGNDPEAYLKAIPLLLDRGFHGVDINMGCPAHKVVRRGECSGLIDRPSLAKELILAAREAAGEKPVSVKTRLGVKTPKTESWMGFLLELDLPVLTVHGRIAAQMSEGEADWGAIRRVREMRDQMGKSTRIVGNGDLFSADDLDRRHRESGVDGLMVGRGIFRDPDIFRRERPHRNFEQASWEERKAVMVQHVEEHRRVWGGVKGYDMLKQFFKVYTRGPEAYLILRESLFGTRSHDEALDVLDRFRQS